MKTVIINAKIVTSEKVIANGVCAFEDGVITYVGREMQTADCTVDAHDQYLIPGFIDLHCHGGNGLEFMDASADEMDVIARFHLSHGTTTMLATTLAASDEETERALDTFADYQKRYEKGTLIGVHMEGPWLNPVQCGAQNTAYMKNPSADELNRLKARYPFILRVGAAPELTGGLEFGKASETLGIVASVAHTDADFQCIAKAKENGYTLMTHLYSGMKGLTRKNSFRIAGAVEAGLYFDDLFVEIIADGRHLPIELLQFIYKCKGADRICLITDAIRAGGMQNGSQTVIGSLKNGLPVIVEDDVAKLLDRQSFAGSTATADRLYKTMAGAIGKDMVALSKMASLTPARVMGWTDRGEIAVGKRADLLVINEELIVEKIIFKGKNI
ncbi:MAG: N-acetylglucosamine-6-phosphate deacetylase [Clostridiales bacterium]|nr:N-acetylglucosamine-6-phosphate deacetylase [Clostridiales bacterium]